MAQHIERTGRGALEFAATVSSAFDDTVGAQAGGELGPGATAPRAAVSGTPDRYRLESLLGEGGMGSVHDATDTWFGRHVAFKELRISPAPASLTRRFVLEALITANLEHPGIVAVHEHGVRDGKPYYVMRKLGGRTLAEALANARTTRERLQFVPAVVRVAQTIAFAHDHGVIHRDLKPENVVVGAHGEVTVIDWGIAKVMELERLAPEGKGPAAASIGDLAAGHTVAGSVLGTPAYMAPEQAAGQREAIDKGTDVFALGALLYHVLSGRPPYEGTTLQAIIAKAAACDHEPLRTVAPKAPAHFVAICERAMAKSPEDRFRSAGDLAEALEDALTDALAVKESRWLNALVSALTVLLLLVAMAGSIMAWRVVPSLREMGEESTRSSCSPSSGSCSAGSRSRPRAATTSGRWCWPSS